MTDKEKLDRLREAAEKAADAFEDLLYCQEDGTLRARAEEAWHELVRVLDEDKEGGA
jgi:hypothetical protein